MFMDECLEMEYVYILIKPIYNAYTAQIIEHLKENLGFILLDSHTVDLTKMANNQQAHDFL